MNFFDILKLSLRNLRGAKLRVALTTAGVVIGVAVIVSMISFGLGLRRDALARFQKLDAFSEVHVYGRSLLSLASDRAPRPGAPARPVAQVGDGPHPDRIPQRSLDDGALEEIARIPGVTFIRPHILFSAYVQAAGRTQMISLGGALASDPSTQFREFAAGKMFDEASTDEAVVSANFMRGFGYRRPSDGIGQTIELLDAPANENGERAKPDELVVARSFRIVGVLREAEGGNRFRGMVPMPDVYLPMQVARAWKDEHQESLNQVALRLARKKGSVGEQEKVSFTTAVLRVTDPVVLSEVRQRLTALGFGSFSFIDEFKQVQTTFLIINSALGLLGGISLLVASLGITNTMLMSILERTREIGIMKAIGAKDREIKLIFFVEAAVIGLVGGTLGALLAWGLDALGNEIVNKFILETRGAGYIDLFSLPAYLWLGAILFAVLVSIAAALYPAARASRVNPVTALRHD
ncbi:MAG TPA: FtsX-like permease family protein [Pyrinomonadaceae bacterium]|nr:FtsX-like permease family protein [Pyrinomonadaceae bacterium]